MTKWLVGDVLLWAEPDWFAKGKRKKEFFKKGVRVVAAQILSVDPDYVRLEVLSCEIAYDHSAKGVKVLKVGEVIPRKLATLKKRDAQRIDWGGRDGEKARAIVKSKFLGAGD